MENKNKNEVKVETLREINSLSELTINGVQSLISYNGVDDYNSEDYTDDTEDEEDYSDSDAADIDIHSHIEPFREALKEERHLHHETTKKLRELRVTNHQIATELKEDREEIAYLKETIKKMLSEGKERDALLKTKAEQHERVSAAEKEIKEDGSKTPSSTKKKVQA